MKERISSHELIKLLEKVCLEMEGAQERLRQIDAAAGDGDLGVSVNLGSKAIREGLSNLTGEDIGAIFTKSGMTFNRAGASTFGTLLATGFMRAGREAKGLKEIGIENIVAMMKSAIQGIQERGKASKGERTILDALIPAQEALEKYALGGKSLSGAMVIAAEAAEKGAEATRQMKAKHGRAGWLAERAVGLPDGGAVAIAIMLRAVSKYLKEKSETP